MNSTLRSARRHIIGFLLAGIIGFAAAVMAVWVLVIAAEKAEARTHRRGQQVHQHDARPARWCGWWLRQHLGIADRRLNRARNWARLYGRPSGPCVRCVVVWRHHVGIIIGRRPDGHYVVLSGNDGHRVRARPRSVAGAIAFRQG